MQGIITLSDKASALSVPSSTSLPNTLSMCIHVMNRVHWLWRWHFMVTQVYMNSTNLKKLLAGYIVNYTVGENTIIRIAAQVVLIAVRIVDLGKQKYQVYMAYCELKNSVFAHYHFQIEVRLPSQQTYALKMLGPEHYIFVMKRKEKMLIYVGRINRCTLILFKEMFKTSMCYMDIIEAFSMNSAVRTEAVNQIFINSTRLLDDMCENKQHIHAELLKHKGIIEQILTGIGSPYKAEQLIDAVGRTLSQVERTYNTAKYLYDNSENRIKDGLSSMAISFFNWTPGILLPEDPDPIRTLPMRQE